MTPRLLFDIVTASMVGEPATVQHPAAHESAMVRSNSVDEIPATPEPVPGGYGSLADTVPREPRDGAEELLAGEILLPLGFLATASGAALTYVMDPVRCPGSLGVYGKDFDQSKCKTLFIVNAVRTGYGAAMMITGAVLLSVGLKRRAEHRRWKRGDWSAYGGATPSSVHAGWVLRF